jgi:uncharacterized membrane protein
MSVNLVRAVRWTAIAAGVVGYPVLAHYSAATAASATFPSLGVTVSLAPLLAGLLWLSWHSPRRLGMLLLCAAVCVLLWGFWGALEQNFAWVYFIQHAGTNVMLAAVFGLTLARGRQPLCTRLAEAVRGSLGREVLRYTRAVTLAWTLFFLVISLASTVLFLSASIDAWSVFANFLWLPLILLMFVAEHLVRLRKLPHLEQHSIMDSILAFWKTAKVSHASSPHTR